MAVGVVDGLMLIEIKQDANGVRFGRKTVSAPGSAVTTLDFDEYGQKLVFGNFKGEVWLLDLERSGTAPELVLSLGSKVTSVRFDPKGERLLVGSNLETGVWSVDGKEGLGKLSSEGVISAAWIASGDQILTVAESEVASLWSYDANEGRAASEGISLSQGYQFSMYAAQFHPLGGIVAAATDNDSHDDYILWWPVTLAVPGLERFLDKVTRGCVPGFELQKRLEKSPQEAATHVAACAARLLSTP